MKEKKAKLIRVSYPETIWVNGKPMKDGRVKEYTYEYRGKEYSIIDNQKEFTEVNFATEHKEKQASIDKALDTPKVKQDRTTDEDFHVLFELFGL